LDVHAHPFQELNMNGRISFAIAISLASATLLLAQEPERRPAQRRPGQRVGDLAAQAARLLTSLNVQRDIEYGRAGERSLKLDLVRPKDQGNKKLPVIVFIHGGGWQNGDKGPGLVRLGQLVATGKYVGASVGYRLSGEAIWPAQIHDCKAAIRFLRASADQYGIDPEKIGVWGVSAGGHLVSLLGTSGDVKELEGANGSPGYSSRVTCVVDFCGPADFLAFGKQNPSMNRPGAPVVSLFGGPLAEKEAEARQASPVTHITRDDPPFLVVHGTADSTVPIAQADRFAAALEQAGVDVTYVKIEGGGHGIVGPEVSDRVARFFEKHLLGQDVKVSGEPIKAAVPRR
jgi:acetyl esterase/lipase